MMERIHSLFSRSFFFIFFLFSLSFWVSKTRQVEALKRELANEDSSSRAILRDRLAEKGPAPSPPVVNKTREVDYVGFAK